MKKLLIVMALTTMTVAASAQLRSGINLNDLDTSVRPADDFYEYACGGWMKANPLPAAYSRYGSFDRLAEDNNKRINGILKELLENTTNKWTTQNGVKGRLFTSKKNGKSLFLPAAGYRWDSNLYLVGSDGNYWSSSLYTDGPNDAW